MTEFEKFIIEHADEEPAELLLHKDKWPYVDIIQAANTIGCRKRLKHKVPEWYEATSLLYPDTLCAEQCSSTETAFYKASIAKSVIGSSQGRIADITGGLGIDSWAFSSVASQVFYNEMKPALVKAAINNFKILEINNISISNETIDIDNIETLLYDFKPDLIFMDPARRSQSGKKLFLIEDCSPDILTLKDKLLSICNHIMVKLSPMADISMVAERFGREVREIHIIGSKGECKELLVIMEAGWKAGYSLIVYDSGHSLEISREHEKKQPVKYIQSLDDVLGKILVQPGKALMKTGRFNYMSSEFDMSKLGVSTHLYITDNIPRDLNGFCKFFKVIDLHKLDSKSLKSVGKQYVMASVTAKNIPMKSEELRKRMKTSDGGNIHIFGVHIDNIGNYLLITEVSTQFNSKD